MNPNDLIRNLYSDLRSAVDSARADRAIAQGTQTAGLVTIQRLDASTADMEQYARVKGFATSDQDEVVVLQMKGGATFVLGTLQRTAPTGYTLDAPLTCGGVAATTLSASSSLTVSGAANLGGEVYASAGIVNSDTLQPHPVSQDGSDTPSTGAVGTYQNAMTYSLALPAGTWTVTALFGLAMKRNPAGLAYLRGSIDGNLGGSRAVNLDLSVYTLHWQWHQVVNVTGGRSIALIVQFVGGSGVTLTSAAEPILVPWLQRTS